MTYYHHMEYDILVYKPFKITGSNAFLYLYVNYNTRHFVIFLSYLLQFFKALKLAA